MIPARSGARRAIAPPSDESARARLSAHKNAFRERVSCLMASLSHGFLVSWLPCLMASRPPFRPLAYPLPVHVPLSFWFCLLCTTAALILPLLAPHRLLAFRPRSFPLNFSDAKGHPQLTLAPSRVLCILFLLPQGRLFDLHACADAVRGHDDRLAFSRESAVVVHPGRG